MSQAVINYISRLLPVPADVKHFAPSVKGAAVTLEHDDMLLFQAQPTLLGGGVVCWGLGQRQY